VPARDTTALANGILRLATDGELRKVMGEAGRKRLATHFSAETVIRKTDSLYRSLLSDAKTVKQAIAPFDGNADPARPIPMES
jgi:glycosyltransferase involved in cell wall biosynthesis